MRVRDSGASYLFVTTPLDEHRFPLLVTVTSFYRHFLRKLSKKSPLLFNIVALRGVPRRIVHLTVLVKRFPYYSHFLRQLELSKDANTGLLYLY